MTHLSSSKKTHFLQRLVLVLLICAVFTFVGVSMRLTSPLAGATANDVKPSWRSAVQSPDSNPALNTPDEFNWQLFVQISQAAPTQNKVGPKNVTTNNVLWETWANDPDTFPQSPDPSKCNVPNPNPNNCPVWPGTTTPPKKILRPSTQQLFRQQQRNLRLSSQREVQLLQGRKLTAATPQISVGGSEEVRRNKSSFTFIVTNGLWYQQGLKAAFEKGVQVSFPIDAIEVKARWTPLSSCQNTTYHCNYDSNGNAFGLIALHIMSKAVPNWTWATWEYVGNPGRCDYIGCRDAFGMLPQYQTTPPNPQLNQGYPSTTSQLSPALLQMLGTIGPEWVNYRLKGSQIDFTDATGRATLLGNSITEAGFVQTSSCMTCHAQASVDSTGLFNQTLGFTPNGQSTNGPLQPAWFYNINSNPWTVTYFPIDFVWAIFDAQAAPGP
jgi:hypothetical protein